MKTDIQLHQRRIASANAHMAHTASASSSTLLTPAQGLLVVFTGPGKGKSGAAFNLAWRAIANASKVGVVQFFGGSMNSADYQHLSKSKLCEFQIFGNGCSWQLADHQHDAACVHAAWREAVRMINDPGYGMVILDDLPLMIKYRYLDLDRVLPILRQRRPELHVVIAGRYAPFELTDFADIVTEMRSLKPPDHTIAAQAGIEF